MPTDIGNMMEARRWRHGVEFGFPLRVGGGNAEKKLWVAFADNDVTLIPYDDPIPEIKQDKENG